MEVAIGQCDTDEIKMLLVCNCIVEGRPIQLYNATLLPASQTQPQHRLNTINLQDSSGHFYVN